MTRAEVERVLDGIAYRDWGLELGEVRGFLRSPWFLRVRCRAADPDTGRVVPYVGRKCLVARHLDEAGLVRLAYDAIRHAEEELGREAFRYNGRAVFGATAVALAIAAPDVDVAETVAEAPRVTLALTATG